MSNKVNSAARKKPSRMSDFAREGQTGATDQIAARKLSPKREYVANDIPVERLALRSVSAPGLSLIGTRTCKTTHAMSKNISAITGNTDVITHNNTNPTE